MNKKDAMKEAKAWSKDKENNYGRAYVIKEAPGKFMVCADFSGLLPGEKLIAKFVRGPK